MIYTTVVVPSAAPPTTWVCVQEHCDGVHHYYVAK